jgi:phosphoglycolate phosphatase
MTRVLIVFDLDGTLVDSKPEILAAMRRAWSDVLGPSEPFPAFRIGPPLDPMVAAAAPSLPAERRAEVISAFRSHYDGSDWSATQPYPGILELLERLGAGGEELAVATNKRRGPALGVLNRWFPGRFRLVACSDGVSPDDGTVPGSKAATLAWLLRRTGAEARASVLVGDTVADIEAARTAGMRSVAVLWGYEGEPELLLAKPDAVAADAETLARALAEPA